MISKNTTIFTQQNITYNSFVNVNSIHIIIIILNNTSTNFKVIKMTIKQTIKISNVGNTFTAHTFFRIFSVKHRYIFIIFRCSSKEYSTIISFIIIYIFMDFISDAIMSFVKDCKVNFSIFLFKDRIKCLKRLVGNTYNFFIFVIKKSMNVFFISGTFNINFFIFYFFTRTYNRNIILFIINNTESIFSIINVVINELFYKSKGWKNKGI